LKVRQAGKGFIDRVLVGIAIVTDGAKAYPGRRTKDKREG